MALLSQRPDEIAELLDFFRYIRVRSYLEVGAREGQTLAKVCVALGPDIRAVAVDLPEAAWGRRGSLEGLKAVASVLTMGGCDVALAIGDSRSPDVIEAVKARAPYDACLIDGDHTYEGAKADWKNYGPLCRVVAFHDIAPPEGQKDGKTGKPVEVPRLWAELAANYQNRIIQGSEPGMGIGVLWNS